MNGAKLAAAVRRQYLVFGLSSHRAEHWWFFNGGTACDSDVQVPRYAGLYAPAQPVSWTRDADKLTIAVPEARAFTHAIAFRITPVP
jgi:alpha-L-fucosidase